MGIDPGVNYVAWASVDTVDTVDTGGFDCGFFWTYGSLYKLRELIADDIRIMVEGQYVNRKSAARTKDVLGLAMTTGACLALGSRDSTAVDPALWKGQCPKDVTRRRVSALMTDHERKTFERKARIYTGPNKRPPHRPCRHGMTADMQLDVWHAVGMLFWAVGR